MKKITPVWYKCIAGWILGAKRPLLITLSIRRSPSACVCMHSICSEKLFHNNSTHKDIDSFCFCIKVVQAAPKTALLQNNVHDINQEKSTVATAASPEDSGTRASSFKAGDKVLGFWAEERIWRKAAVIQISQV